MSGTTGPFTLDFALNRGLGTAPGDVGIAMAAAKQDGGGGSPGETYYWVLEDGSGFFELEDGSGLWLLEAAP
jgi:hypothetical protein